MTSLELTTAELIGLLLPTIRTAAAEESLRLSRRPTGKDLEAASARAFNTVLEALEC